MKYARLRGNMTEPVKLVHKFYDKLKSIKFEFAHTHLTHFTCGKSFKLDKSHVHYDILKYFFSNRVTSKWNILMAEVIVV
jgi:succinylglutamate desuccinylase